MLSQFKVEAATDGEVRTTILVEPRQRRCSVTVTVAGRIERLADETDPSFRAITPAEWSDTAWWDAKAAKIARAQSVFWYPMGAPPDRLVADA